MGTSVTSGNTVDNGVMLTSANTTSVSKKHQTILLQTAHAMMVCATPDGPSVPVRVLFDNGSQLSYVTVTLQRQLGLKPVIEKLHLKTIWAQ